MLEACVLLSKDHQPIHWHLPVGRTLASIPESKSFWDTIWENRDNVLGTAHSHPGFGVPVPSYEDVTTWSATEMGLGRRLDWWITSSDTLIHARWEGPDPLNYKVTVDPGVYEAWLPGLRAHSQYT